MIHIRLHRYGSLIYPLKYLHRQELQEIAMNRFSTIIACLGLGLSGLSVAHAADLKRGKQLLEENCIKCHASMMGGDGSKIYTRPDRKVESLEGLNKQVHRCRDSLGVQWPEDQIADVVAYLNKTYYKFK